MGGAIDFGHLERYVGGDQAIILEVLALFADQARTVSAALDPSAPGEQWRDAAHRLKGSALGIGAADLAAACGEAELAEDAPVAVRQAARARIADCLDAALAEISLYTAR